jgi:hypothetical protein
LFRAGSPFAISAWPWLKSASRWPCTPGCTSPVRRRMAHRPPPLRP